MHEQQLLDGLCRLLPGQFEFLLERVGAPVEHLSSTQAPMATRATELLRYARQQGRLAIVERALADLTMRSAPAQAAWSYTGPGQPASWRRADPSIPNVVIGQFVEAARAPRSALPLVLFAAVAAALLTWLGVWATRQGIRADPLDLDPGISRAPAASRDGALCAVQLASGLSAGAPRDFSYPITRSQLSGPEFAHLELREKGTGAGRVLYAVVPGRALAEQVRSHIDHGTLGPWCDPAFVDDIRRNGRRVPR
jgi:hypothetical protein